MSLELVLLVPVLMLLTLFVLWAGRGGRAQLTADLAAEEAATAAALCCEEGPGGERDRESMAEDMLGARPGLDFLCIGGTRPDAPPDNPGGPRGFVAEEWLEFGQFSAAEPESGGVGVLSVEFMCETDGAVAPLRGLFPTVTFHGQASEVVVRPPAPPSIGWKQSKFYTTETETLVFEVATGTPVEQDTEVTWKVVEDGSTTADLEEDFEQDVPPEGDTVTIPAGEESAQVVFHTADDPYFEDDEFLVLVLDPDSVSPSGIAVDPERRRATGEIADNEARPFLRMRVANEAGVVEGEWMTFFVRLESEHRIPVPVQNTVEVGVHTEDIDALGGPDCTAAGTDYHSHVFEVEILPDETVRRHTSSMDLTLTFNPGETSKTIQVETCDDEERPEPEETERLRVVLHRPVGARLHGALTAEDTLSAEGRILDDEATVSVAEASAEEGGPLAFEVTLDRAPTADVVLEYELEDRNARFGEPQAQRGPACGPGVDYEAASGTLTIRSGTDRMSVPPVVTCDDSLTEPDETFWLRVDRVSGEAVIGDPGTGADNGAVGTITDDDTPAIAVRVEPAAEGETLEFHVSLMVDGAPATLAAPVTLNYTVEEASPVSAVQDIDYRAAAGHPYSGTLVFGAGVTTEQPVAVDLLEDHLDEGDETFQLTLRDAGGQLPDAVAVGTIVDVLSPQITVNSVRNDEGATLTFDVTLLRPRDGETVTVDYEAKNGSAKAGSDFEAGVTGTLTLDADNLTRSVAVRTFHDRIAENEETMHLDLSNQSPSHVAILTARGNGFISNVNPFVVRVSDADARREGQPLAFEISVVDDSGQPARLAGDLTVAFATADRDPGALAGHDYTSRTDTAVFDSSLPATTDNRTVEVEVETLADTVVEGSETFALILTVNDLRAVLGDAEGIGTILDSPPPSIRIDHVTAVEGEPLAFTVGLYDEGRRLTSTSETVTVDFETADGTALAGQDYTARSGTVTFDPGEMTEPIEVVTLSDDEVEPPETMRIYLSDPRNAILGDAAAVGTIEVKCVVVGDGIPPPTMIFTDVELREGDTGHPPLRMSQPLCGEGDFTIQFKHVPDTAGCADVETECRLIPTELTLPAVDTRSEEITGWAMEISEDGIDEPDETIFYEHRWGSTMPDHYKSLDWVRSKVTIIDGDDEPILAVGDTHAAEGEPLTFRVSLDTVSGRTVSFDYRTSDGTAEAGADYVAVDWKRAEIPPGDGFVDLEEVTTVDDGVEEGDETMFLEIRRPDQPTPAHALIGDSLGVGTITEGDGPELSVDDAEAAEGQRLAFVVTLSEASAAPVVVDYSTVERPQTAAGTATAGTDYTPAPDGAQLRFEPGQTTRTIFVEALEDEEDEADETFLLELSNPQGASLVDPSALGTILGSADCLGPARTVRYYDATVPVPQNATVNSPSVGEDGGEMTFVVTFDKPYCGRHFWRASLGGSTATRGRDYVIHETAPSTPSLAPELRFTATIIDDDIDEYDETIAIAIVNNAHGGPDGWGTLWTDTGTIVDDDVAQLQLSPDGDPSADEGDYLNFVVRLDRPSDKPVEFYYNTVDSVLHQPIPRADYMPVRGIAGQIFAGDLSTTLAVTTIEDDLNEATESVRVRVSNVSGADPDPNGSDMLGHILDDDPLPRVFVSNAAAVEGDVMTFRVRLDRPSGRDTRVVLRTRAGVQPGSASPDQDYRDPGPVRVAIPAGATSGTASVQTLADDEVEGDETFFVDAAVASFDSRRQPTLEIGDGTGVGTIGDASPREVRVSDAYVVEGGDLAFEVTFDGSPSARDITVRYQTQADSATAGADYRADAEAVPRLVRILAGETSATIRVPTVQDRLDEVGELLRLVLSSPQGAVIVDDDAVGLIVDDDPAPSLTVDDIEATEGDGATATFTVRLSEPSGRSVTVDYATEDGTAKAGDDYVAASDTLTFDPGDRQKPVTVTLVNDAVPEDPEIFRLVLSNPSGASFGDGVGVARILDDDGPPEFLVDGPGPVREEAGASAVFTVRLSRASTDRLTVDYVTEDGTAKAGDDYVAASGTLTFDPGDLEKPVTVTLVNDDIGEDAETFRLKLSNPGTGAELGVAVASVLVLDDDRLPVLSVSDTAATEGTEASFAVTLSRASARAVTATYTARTDPTAGDRAATAGQDYRPVTGTLTVAARSTRATVRVPLPDDALDEHAERFWLRLTDPEGATIRDGTAVGTVIDDDPRPSLNVADAGAAEGRPLRFRVTLDAPSGREVTVDWATATSSAANAALAGDDFVTASGTLTFRPGTTEAAIVVATVQDELSEPDETFRVTLRTPRNAVIGDGAAVGAIRDDDGLPRVSVADTTVFEDDSPATFTVTLSRLSSRPVTVYYILSDGTATQPADYDGRLDSGRALIIPAGLGAGEISVFVNDDDLDEGTETFRIRLYSAINAVIAEGAGTATARIIDDDRPRISVGAARATEGDGTIDFPVTLDRPGRAAVTVRYATFDGTATQPADYTAASGRLQIPEGDTTATIAVSLADDGYFEEAESLLLRLSGASGAEIDSGQAVGIILDDDELPVIKVDAVDGGEDAGTLTYTVRLSKASDKEVRVDYRTRVDYQCGGAQPFKHVSGTLVFEPGAVTRTVNLPLVDNDYKCPNPNGAFWRVDLDLSNPVNAVIGRDIAPRAFIWDDENVPSLEFEPRSAEAVESAGAVSFTIRMARINDTDVTIPYTAGGISALAARDNIFSRTGDQFHGRVEATATDDFTAVTGTATILAGQRSTTVSVPIVDDTDSEPTEHFGVLLTRDNSRYTIGGVDHSALGTIIDNDGASLSVQDVEISEGAGSASFRVSLDRPSSQQVTVDYATADGTASQPGDYTAAGGSLTFEPGATEAFADVTLVDDADEEPDESFTLTLTNPRGGAAVSVGSATATIIDDDGDQDLPVLWISDAIAPEDGRLDADGVEFAYRLSKTPTETITVHVQTIETPWLGDRAATANVDYIAQSSKRYLADERRGIIGDTEGYFQVLYRQDRTPEHDEMFMLLLSDPVGVVLGNDRAWGTILNNDVPIVSIENVTASEGDAGVTFTVQLHAPGVRDASVRYRTVVRGSEGDAAATPGEDYAHTAGKLDIAAGRESATITVPITGDAVDELDESFIIELYEPELLTLGVAAAVGTITDDDPGWHIDDRSVWENEGSIRGELHGTMVFTVTRDHTSPAAVTLSYRVTGASAVGGDSCTDGVDYVSPPGSVGLLPSQTTTTISVTVCNDDVTEGRETLLIELSGVPGRKLTGAGTIIDDD